MPRHVSDSWKDYLGPGALTTFSLAALTALVGLGAPVFWRLAEVLRVARRQPPLQEADAIVVLGRQLERDQPSAVFRARLEHGAALWREGLAPLVVLTGGLTGAATRTEAEAGRELLVAAGVPLEVIVCEGRSRHTLENLYNTREDLGPGRRRIIVVSDDLHLARACTLASNLGFEVTGSAAPAASARSLTRWIRGLREAALLHWYLVGVKYSRLIGSERLLSRVT